MTAGDVVVVTGFTAFQGFTENPSSDIVDLLEKKKIPAFDGKLVTAKMDVVYEEVEETVNKLWEKKPKLVVHLGVHGGDRHIKLENRSFGKGYTKYDVRGCVPKNNVCPGYSRRSSPTLYTSINCAAIAAQVSNEIKCEDLAITDSDDPGRYLCAYSYYLSLSHDKSRSLFIHVPEFDEVCTLEVVTEAIQKIILAILKTLN
ncbi:unnamed protein product [Cylicocyclus nassatus]|uniref:Pyroglutamyl-peptidase I n=1 Tax=Cylicocyclus nassatus TaxID=53992 RepID=A0AA36M0D6_CYLNA|nr:unnamed protein product [Cylicocyclus nassatus]